MTPEEIENMPAGRDMDFAIAELLGVEQEDGFLIDDDGNISTNGMGDMLHLPRYSADIAAAMTLLADVEYWQIMRRDKWVTVFINVDATGNENFDEPTEATARNGDEALAICRAFLLWKGQDGQAG